MPTVVIGTPPVTTYNVIATITFSIAKITSSAMMALTATYLLKLGVGETSRIKRSPSSWRSSDTLLHLMKYTGGTTIKIARTRTRTMLLLMSKKANYKWTTELEKVAERMVLIGLGYLGVSVAFKWGY